MPAALATLVGFEIPLGDKASGADLLVRVEHPARLADPSLSGPLGGDREAYGRVAALAASPEPPLAGPIVDAWLEWDVGSGRPDRASVFVSPAQGDRRAAPRLSAIAAALTGSAPPRALERVAAALPAGCEVIQVGAMLGRPEGGLRLCVSALDPLAVVEALPAAGWPGEPAAGAAALARYLPLATRAVLALDLTDAGLGPRLGMELVTWAPQAAGPLLERLVDDGLAVPDRAAAVAAWPGADAEPGPDPWPRGLLGARALLGGRARTAVLRGVNHVKLTVASGGPAAAKAYLGAVARAGRPC